ncbi:hypothetical protein N566_20540 [Streptomycetaceae bacterium MP113-05]|nr:hypothetical protein N566_20540 [Streptomycetaceae bacterium MP113-05]
MGVAGSGCGNSDEPEADGKQTATATDPSPPRDVPAPDRETPPPRKKEKDVSAGLPKVPKAELTPATGSFTAKQKKYLVDRVPEGYEPAAALEAGQAICQRIARTAKVDRKAAVSALESGEISGAKDAVLHLCPKHKPLLQAAGLLD